MGFTLHGLPTSSACSAPSRRINAEAGTHLSPIKETPHFEERSKVYALGELWLSYADGKSEAPLFDTEGR
jgi:hypothetical protein